MDKRQNVVGAFGTKILFAAARGDFRLISNLRQLGEVHASKWRELEWNARNFTLKSQELLGLMKVF